MPISSKLGLSSEGLTIFHNTVLEKYDDALAHYMLILNSSDIVKDIENRKNTLLYTKIYFYTCLTFIAMITALEVALVNSYAHYRALLVDWPLSLLTYAFISYFMAPLVARKTNRHDRDLPKIFSTLFTIVTGLSLMFASQYIIGVFLYGLVVIDQHFARNFAALCIKIKTLVSGDQDPEWLRGNVVRHSDEIIHHGITSMIHAAGQVPSRQTLELKLPSQYTGDAANKAKLIKNKSSDLDIKSFEDIFVDALNKLPWVDQLSLRLAMKLYTSEALAEVLVEHFLCEFYQQTNQAFNKEEIKSSADYLYSAYLYSHAMVPVDFRFNNQDAAVLSNLADAAWVYGNFKKNRLNQGATRDLRTQSKVKSIESLDISEPEFMRLHGALSTFTNRFFTATKSRHSVAKDLKKTV